MRQRSPFPWLIALLIVAYGLRVWLACSGGQEFWPDESRYGDTREAAYQLVRGHWRLAADALFGHADHILFRWFSLPPAIVEQMAGNHPALVASYLSLFSVLAIALIWAIARRAGGDDAEALWAAYLAACANSLFYYSRHFFPYDIALAVILAALWIALGPWSPRRSFFAGVVVGIGFLVYNGYWLLGGCVLILHVLLGEGGPRRGVKRAACAASGLILVIAALVGAGRAFGHDLISGFRQLAGNIRGDFYIGHRVIPEFLWHAEGSLLILWLMAFAYALRQAWREPGLGRLAWYGSGVLLIGAGLIFFSDVVPQFMVQGRLVRSLVPFLCLGAAVGVRCFVAGGKRSQKGRAAAVAAVAGLLSVGHFFVPLRQVFPDEFHRLASLEIARQPRDRFYFYRLAFAEFLWARPVNVALPAGIERLRRSNPFQFEPFQYEGYDAGRRAELKGRDISMRLIELPVGFARDPGRWAGYPGPVNLSVVFPSDNIGRSEPLITAGRAGRGDFLFVRYLDTRHVSFGMDHWGGGESLSAPLEVDYRVPHEITVSLGTLLPPAESGYYAAGGVPASWRDQLLVILDGRVVFFRPQEFFSVQPYEIRFGVNLIGGTGMEASFTGKVLAFGSASADRVRSALAVFSPAVHGPLRLELQLPGGRTGRREPLVVTGRTGRGDLLEIRYEDAGHIRFALDHWGRSYQESEPVAIDYNRIHLLEIHLPTLAWPEPADGGTFTGELSIRLDGEVVWRAPAEFYRAARGTLAVATNRIGGSTCDPAFTGILMEAGNSSGTAPARP